VNAKLQEYRTEQLTRLMEQRTKASAHLARSAVQINLMPNPRLLRSPLEPQFVRAEKDSRD
jgi:hypothetical protein